MSKFPNDDLFEGSKMTFGEHLEELRVALWRAVIGLAVGVTIGFLIGDRVVVFIQTPLKAAMEDYLLERAVDDVSARFAKENREAGGAVENVMPPGLEKFVRENHVQPKVLLVLETEAMRLAKSMVERMSGAVPGETPKPMLPMPVNGAATPADPAKVAPAKIDPAKAAAEAAAAAETPRFVQILTWEPIIVKVSAMNASEAFMIYVQAAIVSGLVFSSPWVIYQIWNFVAEGLYPHEKQYVYIFLPISLGLFLAGAALAFFFVFQPVLSFLFTYNKALQVDPDPRISEWIGFVLMLPIGFGLAFQLPLVMLFIERIGVVSVETYLSQWRIAILVIFVLSAILTPADPISMLLMALPLTFLYFGGVGLCLWLPLGKKPFEEAYEP